MNWVRKGIVHLFALLLLVALLVTAYGTSFDLNLSKPAKVETWLNQSNLYGHFVSEVISQSKQSVGSSDQNSSISLSDSAVQQAAQNAFSPKLIQQDINTFIDSNYAWLQGKTAVPNFKIDLTSAKESFGQQVGQYVTAYFSGLPVCTAAQEAQLTSIDPLTAPCRPASISANQEGLNAEQQITSSNNFLSNPVLTAGSINPNSTTGSTNGAYFQKLSALPKVYRWLTRLPLIAGGLAVVLALGIIFIHPSRRKGLRRVGIVSLVAGIILTAGKFIADAATHRIENQVFNKGDIGQLQQSLTTFADTVERAVSKTDLYFGIAFIVIGLAVLFALIASRNRPAKVPSPLTGDGAPQDQPDSASTPDATQVPARQSLPVLSKPLKGSSAMDVMRPKPTAPLAAKPAKAKSPAAKPQPQTPKPRRPRLVQ